MTMYPTSTIDTIDENLHDENNREHINELARKLREEILLRQQNGEYRNLDDTEQLIETIERIKPVQTVSVKDLAITDGSLELQCTICFSKWFINVYERNYVFTDECKCRKCILNSGVRNIADFPLMPVLIEVNFDKKRSIGTRINICTD